MKRRALHASVLAIGFAIAWQSHSVLQASPENVIWTNFVHTSANGNTLIHDSAEVIGGATSVQSIASGNGYVEFTVAASSVNAAAGLSHGNTDASFADIDFAIKVVPAANIAGFWRNGTYVGEVSIAIGDVMRVEVSGSNVIFKKNGSAALTLTNPGVVYPLIVDSFMDNPNSTVNNVVISGASSSGSSGSPVDWTSLVHASANGGTLTHDGVDAVGGAVSTQTIASGDGFAQFTVVPESINVAAGLSNGNTNSTLEDIDFAIKAHMTVGVASFWRNGTWVGETPIVAGDVLRVDVSGTNVLFKKNGTTITTLTNPGIVYPLLVDAFMDTVNSVLANARTSASGGSGGEDDPLSSLYPGDAGIANDPDVVFAEDFEQSDIEDLFARWTDVCRWRTSSGCETTQTQMSFTADVPAGSAAGSQSLDIPWTGGNVNRGGHLWANHTKWRDGASVDDVLYVRYYIKYPSSGNYHHASVWVGGYAQLQNWPNGDAGVQPNGADFFTAAGERFPGLNRFDHYNYWTGMHQSGNNGPYWGNHLLNDPSIQGTPNQWMCVEQMVRLNNPVSASNGEHALWINGVKISHLGPGFPNGTWSGGVFTQNPSGSPFEGFQWRDDSSLNLNWIWLQNYLNPDEEAAGFTGHMLFDHLVVAKRYVGCMTQ